MPQSLLTEIASAFQDAPFPVDASISVVAFDDEGTSEHFSGTHWRDHHVSDLEHYAESLLFFTPEAFVFFLPAYLLAAIQNPLSGLVDSIVRSLCPPKNEPTRPSYAAWWSRLSPAQRRVVVAFLREAEAGGRELPAGAIASLDSHLVV